MISKEKFEEILQQNRVFYDNVAEEFTKTRKGFMPGWMPLKKFITNKSTVLDLACGNGRFCLFLTENYGTDIKYTGVDENESLLNEAKKLNKGTFVKLDVVKDLNKITDLFDIVTAFGLTHHLPGKDFRKLWFKHAIQLVNSNGYFIFSNWLLDSDPRINKSEKVLDMEENDYLYGWGDTDFLRYVHLYSAEEVKEIVDLLKKSGLELVENYQSDGKNGKMNDYYVFKRS